MAGWIKIDRQILNHWIWSDPNKLKWWLDILLTVNYADNKVNIGNQLFECKRGQSIMSLQTWALRWNVSKDMVRNFFILLEKDKMITLENLVKTTRITVCNYEAYQGDLHDTQTQAKRKPNANQTQSHPIEEIKEIKESKEEEIKKPKFNFLNSLLSLEIEKEVAELWIAIRKKKKCINSELAFNDLIDEIKKTDCSANECIKYACVNSWGGFKAEWMQKQKPASKPLNGMFRPADNFE